MSFDVKKFLSDYDITHREHGQKTTKGWVQVQQCPFCFGDNYYLGINIQNAYFHCWFCGASGSISHLIKHLLNTTYRHSKKIADEYGWVPYFDQAQGQIEGSEEVKIAGLTTLRKIHIDYLKRRNFDHNMLEHRYRIQANYTVGRFPYRIVIPVFDNGVLVNSTSRDVTDQQQERYLSLSNSEAIIPIKECVYNIDVPLPNDNLLVVEGPFDVWRIGGATVSLFGTAFKTAQVMRIVSKCPRKVFILFDSEPEAQKNADKLAHCLAPFVNHVQVVELPGGDPGDLTETQASNVRAELNL